MERMSQEIKRRSCLSRAALARWRRSGSIARRLQVNRCISESPQQGRLWSNQLTKLQDHARPAADPLLPQNRPIALSAN